MLKNLILGLIVSLLLISCSSKEDKKDVLVVGMELAYPPFEMSDKEGNPSGISVDFARALAKSMGKELEVQNIAWVGLIPSLKTGKVDLIISSMTITKERLKSIDFSDPYSTASLAILAGINSGVDSMSDLNQKGKVVAVKKGTTAHVYATKFMDKAEILVFDNEASCVLVVVQGKADGTIYGQLTVYNNWKKHPKTTKALLTSFQKDKEYWGVAIKQGNDELKQKVNAFIKTAKKDGTFDKLSYKYLKETIETFDKLNIPFFF
ncbi:MAG: transporter substrate-binding domain-containing protein [Flavobacteriales bacterium]|nr:transporter substrate-binding domain-containing protein [Flavobacteriales bacterium]